MFRYFTPRACGHYRSIIWLLVSVLFAAGADAAVVRLTTKKDLLYHGLIFPLTDPPASTPILLTQLGIQVFSSPTFGGEGSALSIHYMGLVYQLVEGSEVEGMLPDLAALAPIQADSMNSNAWWTLVSSQPFSPVQPASSMTWYWDLLDQAGTVEAETIGNEASGGINPQTGQTQGPHAESDIEGGGAHTGAISVTGEVSSLEPDALITPFIPSGALLIGETVNSEHENSASEPGAEEDKLLLDNVTPSFEGAGIEQDHSAGYESGSVEKQSQQKESDEKNIPPVDASPESETPDPVLPENESEQGDVSPSELTAVIPSGTPLMGETVNNGHGSVAGEPDAEEDKLLLDNVTPSVEGAGIEQGYSAGYESGSAEKQSQQKESDEKNILPVDATPESETPDTMPPEGKSEQGKDDPPKLVPVTDTKHKRRSKGKKNRRGKPRGAAIALVVLDTPLIGGAISSEHENGAGELNEEDKLLQDNVTPDSEGAGNEQNHSAGSEPENADQQSEQKEPDERDILSVDAAPESETPENDRELGEVSQPTRHSEKKSKKQKQAESRKQKQAEKKQPDVSGRGNPPAAQTVVAQNDKVETSSATQGIEQVLLLAAAPAERVCGQHPDRGAAKGFRKYCDSLRKGLKKLADKLGKWLFSKSRKKAKVSAKFRPRGSSQSSPMMTTGYTLFAVSVAAAASLAGYWYLSADTGSEGDKGTEPNDSGRLPPEPEADDTKLQDPVDCTKVRNSSLRSRCEKLSARKEHVAARLIRYFDLNRWRMSHFYVNAVYKVTEKGKLMLEPLDPEERDSVLYGAVGYPARHSQDQTGSPLFHIDSRTYFDLISKAAKKLAGLAPDTLSVSLTGRLDPIAQALFWCGIPKGEPADRLHQSCLDWLVRQIESLGAGWYTEGGHGLYYRMLTEPYELTPGKRYLGYLPRFYLRDTRTISELWYDPRVLVISREGRSLNIPTDRLPQPVQSLDLEGLPETFDILVPTKINRWYAVRKKVHRQGAEFQSNRARLGYAIRQVGERYPERFFTFSGEELLESPLNREPLAPEFSRDRDFHGAGHLNPAVHKMPWRLYLHEELHIAPRSAMTEEKQTELAVRAETEESVYPEHAVVAPPDRSIQEDFVARTKGLEPLLEHYFNAREYDKGNMVSALLKDRELPVGVIDFQVDQGTMIGVRYRPLTVMPIEQQARIFEKSYRECEKSTISGRCDYSDSNHVEILRFHMAICTNLTISGCVMMAGDKHSSSSWESLIHMLGWSESEHPLFYPADQIPAGVYVTFPRLLIKERQLSLEIDLQASSKSGGGIEAESIFFKTTYQCAYQGVSGDYQSAGERCQTRDGWTIITPYQDGRLHLSVSGGADRWLAFKDGQLLQPFWNREANWFQKHVWYKPLEKSDLDTDAVADEKKNLTGRETLPVASQEVAPTAPELLPDVCRDITSNNLRDVCIGLNPDNHQKAMIRALSRAAEKNQWLPVFRYFQQQDPEDKPVHYYRLNRRVHFNDLPADRIAQHLRLLKRFPQLAPGDKDESGWTVLAYTGLVENLLPEMNEQELHELMYSIINNYKFITRVALQSPWHRCYMEQLSSGRWCSDEECLLLAPEWKVEGEVGALISAPLLFSRNKPVADTEPLAAGARMGVKMSRPAKGEYQMLFQMVNSLQSADRFKVEEDNHLVSMDVPVTNTPYVLMLDNAVEPYTFYMVSEGKLIKNGCFSEPELELIWK